MLLKIFAQYICISLVHTKSALEPLKGVLGVLQIYNS